jgi:hypothetical protein
VEQFGGYVNAYRQLEIEYEKAMSMNASMTSMINVDFQGSTYAIYEFTPNNPSRSESYWQAIRLLRKR